MPATSCSSARPSVPFPPGWGELGQAAGPGDRPTTRRPFPPGWEEAATVRRPAGAPEAQRAAAGGAGATAGPAFPPGWRELGGRPYRTFGPGWEMGGSLGMAPAGEGGTARRLPAHQLAAREHSESRRASSQSTGWLEITDAELSRSFACPDRALGCGYHWEATAVIFHVIPSISYT